MSKPKGTKNKRKLQLPEKISWSTEERVDILANIIVDRIFVDQNTNEEILGLIEARELCTPS